jgi:IclR family pca regulon transcriptional regulator
MGRIQLGFLDDAEIWRRLKSVRFEPLTPATITDLQALQERIRDDHRQGFSIVDEELERGLRSIAAPVVDRDGQCVGALNLSTHSTRTTRNALRETFLPELNSVAEQVSALVF